VLEVLTILLNAGIHSFHHIVCHSMKSSLIYACNGLLRCCLFLRHNTPTHVRFHATNWSTAWGTVMSHCSRSVSSLYQLQYYQPILILRSETGRVLKWTHCIFLTFGPISRQLPYFHSYATGHKTLHKWTQILIPTSPTGTARLNTVYMTFSRSAVKTVYSSAAW
jgi:hypothetical protein